MLYFAYGSNMSIKRLTERVPSAIAECTGILYGHKLAFHKKGRKDGSGKCDAYQTKDPADYVLGVIYRINSGHKDRLDEIEGLGNGYEIMDVRIKTYSNNYMSAFTYYATNIIPDLRPFEWYKHHVVCGARESNLPKEYIDLILSTESVEDPDTERSHDELSIYTRNKY